VVQALKTDHLRAVETLKEENRASLQLMRDEHRQTVSTLMQEKSQAIALLEKEHERRFDEMQQRSRAEYARLLAERDGLTSRVGELNATIAGLNSRIKEARLSNMFSVSKSGEKLIRVVRSVQELATELDETSRAVTDGEYSFFAEIKDKRDKEAVLSLTGGDRVHDQEEVRPEEPVIDHQGLQEGALAAADDASEVSATDSEPGGGGEPDSEGGVAAAVAGEPELRTDADAKPVASAAADETEAQTTRQ
jgi:hypothetical protein